MSISRRSFVKKTHHYQPEAQARERPSLAIRAGGSIIASALLMAAVGCSANQQPQPPKQEQETTITIQPIKADAWAEEIKKYRGKIVAVDVWATWCPPCKENFPHHVELHKKYQKDGVQFVSVSVDQLPSKDAALKFLTNAGANFPNYLIDHDKAEEYQNLFDAVAVPVYLVYDRDGRMTRFYPNETGNERPARQAQDEMEQLIVQLLVRH